MVIHHHIGQSTTQYDFGAETKRGAFVPHFVAHYADVEHEILEVKSGYRLALTYSLCWKDDGNGMYRVLEKKEHFLCLKIFIGKTILLGFSSSF